jgi:maleate cis-trans isomerase
VFGWRARIGFLSPSPGGIATSLLEMEMAAPEGVAFLSRFLDGPATLETEVLRAMRPQLEPAARALVAKSKLDLILMGGAPVVLANGPDEVIEILEGAAKIPATTNVAGIVNGLRRLGIGKIVVVTPYYPQNMIDMVRGHLEGAGFDIVSMVSGGDVPFEKHKELTEHQTYRLAKNAFLQNRSAEGVVIAGGGAPLHSVLEMLETDIRVPVVANNFASLWNALDMVDVREPIKGYGKLLTCF